MKAQRGYIVLDIGSFFIGLIGVGILIGVPVTLLVQWIFPAAKAWLHAITG